MNTNVDMLTSQKRDKTPSLKSFLKNKLKHFCKNEWWCSTIRKTCAQQFLIISKNIEKQWSKKSFWLPSDHNRECDQIVTPTTLDCNGGL